jgi:hypothetical protein
MKASASTESFPQAANEERSACTFIYEFLNVYSKVGIMVLPSTVPSTAGPKLLLFREDAIAPGRRLISEHDAIRAQVVRRQSGQQANRT